MQISNMTDSPASDEEVTRYLNHYCCPYCEVEWTDEWDCTCDDRCPDCDRPISPYHSDELTD